MKTTKNASDPGRRLALRIIGQGLVGGAAFSTRLGLVFAGDSDQKEGKLDCRTVEKLDKPSMAMRKALKYIEYTKDPRRTCDRCIQWIPAEKGESCGGCKLFSGPVNPQGDCLSFAPPGG